ncbi:hypothetical protein GEMRC1_006555 [Eukaryota sp. GEM-RC1]
MKLFLRRLLSFFDNTQADLLIFPEDLLVLLYYHVFSRFVHNNWTFPKTRSLTIYESRFRLKSTATPAILVLQCFLPFSQVFLCISQRFYSLRSLVLRHFFTTNCVSIPSSESKKVNNFLTKYYIIPLMIEVNDLNYLQFPLSSVYSVSTTNLDFLDPSSDNFCHGLKKLEFKPLDSLLNSFKNSYNSKLSPFFSIISHLLSFTNKITSGITSSSTIHLHLSDCSSFKVMSIVGIPINSCNLDSIIEGNCFSSLEFLEFSKNSLGDDGAIRLTNLLSNFKSLQTLSLRDNLITHTSAIVLSNNIHLTNLKYLDISDNDINPHGVSVVLKSATINLNGLCLSGIGIQDDECNVLSTILNDNKTLQYLNCSRNDIGVRGIMALNSIFENNILKELDLSSNRLTTLGFVSLLTSLIDCTMIPTIDVSDNQISDKYAVDSLKHFKIDQKHFILDTDC